MPVVSTIFIRSTCIGRRGSIQAGAWRPQWGVRARQGHAAWPASEAEARRTPSAADDSITVEGTRGRNGRDMRHY